MDQYAQAIFTMLSLINPVICGALFAQVAVGKSREAQIGDATRTALVVMTILCFAALAGAPVGVVASEEAALFPSARLAYGHGGTDDLPARDLEASHARH
jgi:hypothetical protein